MFIITKRKFDLASICIYLVKIKFFIFSFIMYTFNILLRMGKIMLNRRLVRQNNSIAINICTSLATKKICSNYVCAF